MSYHPGRDPYSDPAAIERRMEELRSELLQRERTLIQSAQKLTYWTRQIHKYSWVIVGIGTAAGFLMLRRTKPQANIPVAATQAAQPRTKSNRSSVTGVITRTLAGVAVRFAGILVVRELQKLMNESQRDGESNRARPHAENGAPSAKPNASNHRSSEQPAHPSSALEQF